MSTFDCTDIKAMLSGLIDDQLDAELRHQAERHLAECSACRALIDEAEAVNELVALDAQRSLWPVGLPSGFEEAVMRRTVYAAAFHAAGNRWASWLGWVAAAACLGLAVSIWVLDRQIASPMMTAHNNSSSSDAGDDIFERHQSRIDPVPDNTFYQAAGVGLKSWVYEGSLPEDALSQLRSGRTTMGGPAAVVLRLGSGSASAPALDIATAKAIDEQLAKTQHSVLEEINRRTKLSTDDSQTLYTASMLLEMLEQANLESFADVERIRQIAEYDSVLERLAEASERLAPSDRPAVLAAESVLFRIVNGPVSLDDLRLLHNTAARLNLSQEIESLSTRGDSASHL